MEDHILIRYGELSLKKSNRKQFTIRIQNHIKRALKEFKQLSFESRGMRYYIMLNNEDSQPIIEILKKIPGIYSFSVVSSSSFFCLTCANKDACTIADPSCDATECSTSLWDSSKYF